MTFPQQLHFSPTEKVFLCFRNTTESVFFLLQLSPRFRHHSRKSEKAQETWAQMGFICVKNICKKNLAELSLYAKHILHFMMLLLPEGKLILLV